MHGLSIAVVAAYDMYLECAEGELETSQGTDEFQEVSEGTIQADADV